jgi:hypothetical protein
MAKPALLYDSRLTYGDVVASSTAVGSDVANLGNWRPYNSWSPLALPATVTIDAATLAWEFANSLDGFTAVNATLTPQPTLLEILATTADPQLFSPAGLAIDGSVDRYLVARVRRDSGGPSWDGRAFYRNAAHDHSVGFFKDIADPTAGGGGTALAIWDMWDLDAGGDDWRRGGQITQLRLDLAGAASEQFSIEWIGLFPSLSADYGLLWGHDLASSGVSVDIETSDDNAVWNSQISGPMAIGADRPWSVYFGPATARWWRFNLTAGYAATLPTIAIAAIGNLLDLPKGFDTGFDPIRREPRGRFSTSVAGNPLGRIVLHEEWRHTLQAQLLTWSWMRETFDPAWREHLRDEPFVLAWDRAAYPDELLLVSSVGGYRAPHAPGGFVDLNFEVKGLARDA